MTWEPDWSAWELHTGEAEGEYSAAAWTAPVLWSRFDKPPLPETETDESGEVAFKLIENGPAQYAIAPRDLGVVMGPVINGAARPMMAEHVEYSRSMTSGGIDVRIERETIGYGRNETEDYVDQVARTTGTLYFTGDASAAMRLVALFHSCRGNVGTMWCPAAHAEWRLAADVTSATVQLEAAPVTPHPAYLVLRKADGTLVARRISAVAGTTLTLDSAPGNFARHSTTLHPLFHGRFTGAELKLEWKVPSAVSTEISLVELSDRDDRARRRDGRHNPRRPRRNVVGLHRDRRRPHLALYLLRERHRRRGAWDLRIPPHPARRPDARAQLGAPRHGPDRRLVGGEPVRTHQAGPPAPKLTGAGS
ncbi:MAG: hypothetical protein IPL39_14415 [Opitutaceae bacterium]|nr:hypothetical protein [Opitutaceae bacterium]